MRPVSEADRESAVAGAPRLPKWALGLLVWMAGNQPVGEVLTPGQQKAFDAFKALPRDDPDRARLGRRFGWRDCDGCDRPYHASWGRFCCNCTGAG